MSLTNVYVASFGTLARPLNIVADDAVVSRSLAFNRITSVPEDLLHASSSLVSVYDR